MKHRWKVILAVAILPLLVLFVGINGAPAANPGASEPGDQPDAPGDQDTASGQVIVGGPVTPGSSPPASSLPTVGPLQPGQPILEVNPRQRRGFTTGDSREESLPGEILAPSSNRTPTTTQNFEGLSLDNGGAGIPPDTVGDVGPNHYIQMVNSAFAIYNKSGTLLVGPTNINELWPMSDTTKCKTENDGDPIVLYDRAAERWMMTQFGVTGTAPFYQCIAVSKTPDPTADWWTYSFPVINSGTEFNDYGKLGVWPDGYYMGANENTFTAYVFERSKMLLGQMATFQKINDGPNMMLPSDLDGAAGPPAGAPNYFYTMLPGNKLEVWAFTVDWVTPANSTFVKIADLTSSGFIYDVCPANPTDKNSFECIAQLGTAQTVDAIGEWPMYRLQYRNHGSHESLVGNFTVDTNIATNADHAGVHWFELRRTGGLGGTWTIYQEGTQTPDNNERWMGSAAMDQAGNIALGYSVSSSAMYPQIRYVTRQATDPINTMGAEVTLFAGTGSQTGADRWGDYSSMNVDPVDDCTFWYTNEYIGTDASGGLWRTRIGSFKEPSCGAPASLALTKGVDNNAPDAGQVINYTITVDNNTMDTATNGVISDTIPAGLTLAGPITLDPAGAGTVGVPPTLVTSLTISTSNRITVTFPVTVSAGISATNVQIVNTAAVTSTETTTPQTGSVAITVNKTGATIYLPVILKN